MQYSTVALLAFVAAASAQTPPGCSTSYSGTFEISPKNITASGKRDLSILERQAEGTCTSTPVITLSDGILTDEEGRTGEIVANYQFQFDKLTQSGAKFTSGFSICENGTLAVGGSAVFYACLSGTFDNLYSESQGAQCFPVYIDIFPCVGPSGTASVPPVTASSTPSTASSTPVAASSTPVVTSSAPVVASSAPPVTMTMAAPFPVANSTTVATGTAVASTAPTTATTSAPATFTPGSGANVLAAGSKVFAAMVGLVAFAMF
jgi:hypothetical protein